MGSNKYENQEPALGFSRAEDEIEAAVRAGESLATVESALFDIRKNVPERDRDFVRRCYTKCLLDISSRSLANHLGELFAENDRNKLTSAAKNDRNELTPTAEQRAIQWVLLFEHELTIEYKLSTLTKLLSADGSPLGANMSSVETWISTLEQQRLLRRLRAVWRENLLGSPQLGGQLGLFRSLLVSATDLSRTEHFYESVQRLWNKCIFKDGVVSKKIESEEPANNEHLTFRQVVDLLPDELQLVEPIERRLRAILNPVQIEMIERNGKLIARARGHQIELGMVLEKLLKKLDEDPRCGEVRLIAENTLFIDVDLDRNGLNVSLIAPQIEVRNKVTWKLNGGKATPLPKSIRKPELKRGENGRDGRDGASGLPGGELLILTDKLHGSELWTVELSGGDGLKGEDGEPGAQGQDGVGHNYQKMIGTSMDIRSTIASAGNLLTLGLGGSLANAINKSYYDITWEDGVREIIIANSYNWLSMHWLWMSIGSPGKLGGRGGRNGCGGRGGLPGKLTVKSSKGLLLENKLTARVEYGADGESGEPGLGGPPGIDGHDIVLCKKTGEKSRNYGTDTEKKKLNVSYVSNYSFDTYNKFYVKARRRNKVSDCYLHVVNSYYRNEHPARDASRNGTRKAETERDQEAQAQAGIDVEAIEEEYAALFTQKKEQTVQKVEELEQEVETEVNRIVTRLDAQVKEPYAAKDPLKLEMLDVTHCEEWIDETPASNAGLWSRPVSSPEPVERILQAQQSKDDETRRRLELKLKLARLRAWGKTQRSSRGQFAATVRRHFLRDRVNVIDQMIIERKAMLEQRDNFSVLRPVDVTTLSSSLDPASSLFLDPELAKQKLKEVLDALLDERMSFAQYSHAESALAAWKRLRLAGKPLADHAEQFFLLHELRKSDKRKAARVELQKMLATATPDEVKALLCAAKVSRRRQTHRFVDEDRAEQALHPAPNGCAAPVAAPLKLLLKYADLNSLFYLFGDFLRLRRRLEHARLLAEAAKLSCQLEASEQDHVQHRGLLDVDQPTVDEAGWLAALENSDVVDRLKRQIADYAERCAAGRLLAAHVGAVNLRVYCQGRLIEDHRRDAPTVLHVELDPKTGRLRPLVVDPRRLKLYITRRKNARDFGCQLLEQHLEELLVVDPPQTVYELCSHCAQGSIREQPEEAMDPTAAIERIVDLTSTRELERTQLKEMLELLAEQYPDVGTQLPDWLLAVFNVDGCHVDAEDLLFIVHSIFVTKSIDRAILAACFMLPLLADSQDVWVDSALQLCIEATLHRSISQIALYRHRVRRLPDVRIKYLLGRRLPIEPIDEPELLDLLDVLQFAPLAYPELESLSLDKWMSTLSEQYAINILAAQPTRLPEADRRRAMFWCLRIGAVYDLPRSELDGLIRLEKTQAEQCYSILASQTRLGSEQQPLRLRVGDELHTLIHPQLDRLIEQLCKREAQIDERVTPAALLQRLFQLVDRAESMPHDYRRPLVVDELIPQIDACLLALCSASGKPRSTATLFELIRTNNLVKPSKPDSDMEQQLDVRRQFIEHLSSSPTLQDTCELQSWAQGIFNKHCGHSTTRPSDVAKALFSSQPEELTDDAEALLLLVDEAVLHERGFRLRTNQKVAILAALRSTEPFNEAIQLSSKGVLQQLSTGEGKTLIICALAIAAVLRTQFVHIVSSSAVLARRDVHICDSLYKLFGIRAEHVCIEDVARRKQIYASSQVIYGDLTGLQRDYLLDRFYGENIMGGNAFGTLIVDEVDSMLLDQGNNMLYLSHDMADLERLQSLFVLIWQLVCQATLSPGGVEEAFKGGALLFASKQQVFGAIALDRLSEELNIAPREAFHLRGELEKRKVCESDGTLLVDELDELLRLAEGCAPNSALRARLKFLLTEVFRSRRVPVPGHLLTFVRRHMHDYVENARTALLMERGVAYQVDMAPLEGPLQYEHKVIIVDSSTGADLTSTQWSNGLHQFLQLKHGLRLTAVSLKAVFVSNVTFLKKYKRVLGFSGTLGAEAEQRQLRRLYAVDMLRLPSSLPKLFYQVITILDRTLLELQEIDRVLATRKEWHTAVYESVLAQIQSHRSVLVICSSIKQVNELSSSVRQLAKTKLGEDSKLYKSFHDAILYRRDRDSFEYGDGKTPLEQRRVIFATNLAGRGTDIKLEDRLVEAGGLHVIVAFLPPNSRVEEQAFGRAARCGEPGTAQLLIGPPDGEQEQRRLADDDVFRLKSERNSREAQRIDAITRFYEQTICLEEECFSQFVECFDQHKKRLMQNRVEETRRQLLLRDLLDRWALWLDEKTGVMVQLTGGQNETTHTDEETRLKIRSAVEETKEFCEKLTFDEGRPVRPMNRLQWGVLQVLANPRIVDDFEHIIAKFPDLAPEAMYYKAYSIVKSSPIANSSDKAYRTAKKLLEKVKQALDVRTQQCLTDRAIVKHFQKKDMIDVSSFRFDLFDRQQLELVQLYELFSRSCDGLLGVRVAPDDVADTMLNEEAAVRIFELLSEEGLLRQPVITTTARVADDYGKYELEELAVAHATDLTTVHEWLAKLAKKERVVADDVLDVIPMPTSELFWSELRRLDCLRNEKDHVFLDKARLQNLNGDLATMISDCATGEKNKAKPVNELWLHTVPDDHVELDVDKLNSEIRENVRELMRSLRVIVNNKSAKFVKSEKMWRSAKTKVSLLTMVSGNLKKKVMDKLDQWKEKSAEETVTILHDKEVIETTEDKTDELVEDLQHFCSISAKKLEAIGVPNGDTATLVRQLIEADVVVEDGNDGELRLKVTGVEKLQTATKLIGCYRSQVQRLLDRYCAFTRQLRELCRRVDAGERLELELPSRNTAKSIFFDLQQLGVLERRNLDLSALKGAQVDDTIVSAATGWVKEGHESRNVRDAAKRTLDELQPQVLKRWRDRVKETKENKPYAEIVSSQTVARIKEYFVQASGEQKYESTSVKLVEVTGRMRAIGLTQLAVQSLLVRQGATHLLEFGEETYSTAIKCRLVAIGTFAVLQLLAGGALLIFTAGAGTHVANFLISEGIIDLLYVGRGALSGLPGSYRQHKMMSMAASAVLGVAGGTLTLVSGQSQNMIAQGLQSSKLTINTGGSVVAFTSLKGFNLILNVGAKRVLFEVGKQIVKRIASAVVNTVLFEVIQKALSSLIQSLIAKLRTELVEMVEHVMSTACDLRQQLAKTARLIGVQNARRLASDCASFVLESSSGGGALIRACDAAFGQYRPIIQSFLSGAQQSGAADDTVVGQVARVAAITQKLLVGASVLHGCSTLPERIRANFCAMSELYAAKTDEAVRVRGPLPGPETSAVEAESFADEMLEQWCVHLGHKIDAFIEQRVACPLLAFGVSRLQTQLERIVAAGYSRLMTWRDGRRLDRIEQLRKEESAVPGSEAKLVQEMYEERLETLMGNTRSPEVVARLIEAGVRIDQTAASAAANVVAALTDKPVIMRITNANGEAFTHTVGNVKRGDVITLPVNLKDEHYGEGPSTTHNSCLFNRLKEMVPELKDLAKGDTTFRKLLGNQLRLDPYFRLHIRNGWHSIAIQKGYLGGKHMWEPDKVVKVVTKVRTDMNAGLRKQCVEMWRLLQIANIGIKDGELAKRAAQLDDPNLKIADLEKLSGSMLKAMAQLGQPKKMLTAFEQLQEQGTQLSATLNRRELVATGEQLKEIRENPSALFQSSKCPLAKTLALTAKTFNEIPESKEKTDEDRNNVGSRGATVAIGVLQNEPSTAVFAINHFNMKATNDVRTEAEKQLLPRGRKSKKKIIRQRVTNQQTDAEKQEPADLRHETGRISKSQIKVYTDKVWKDHGETLRDRGITNLCFIEAETRGEHLQYQSAQATDPGVMAHYRAEHAPHAELQLLAYARERGTSLQSIGVNKPSCPSCAVPLHRQGPGAPLTLAANEFKLDVNDNVNMKWMKPLEQIRIARDTQFSPTSIIERHSSS